MPWLHRGSWSDYGRVKRDLLKFLCGATAAGAYGHVAYARWVAKGTISVPIFKGRPWGIGKLLIEATVYSALSAALGYLAWRPEARQPLEPARTGE